MKISEQKKINLLRIERARIMLGYDIDNGIINEKDIIDLLKLDSSFALDIKKANYKTKVLKNIYNCPFLLCDQEHISLNLKKVLPLFLESRYLNELEELELMYKKGYINKEEYIFEQKILKFNYYQSSEDGKNILKTGHVSCVVDNVLRLK